MNLRIVGAVVVVAIAAIAAVILWPASPRQSPGEGDRGSMDSGPGAAPEPGRLEALRARSMPVDGGIAGGGGASEAKTLAAFGWGSGPGQLGRDRPQEGNPEAPMSLTIDAKGNTWVLDQVNNRLVKLDPSGKPAATVPVPVQAGQDVAIAKDGTAVVMDRLVDRSVSLIGPDGKPKGELPLLGKGLVEGGAATGVFTDGDDVYVEREHGDLVKIGSTSGKADPERPEIPGRPSRDGTSYLSAGIVDAAAGTVTVTAIEKASRAHRFTRQYGLAMHVHGLVLLDSDRSGIIYLGALVEAPGGTPEKPAFAITLLCLDPLDGRPLGRTVIPPNGGGDETFREFAVPDEGGVLYLQRTEQGAQLQRYTCG